MSKTPKKSASKLGRGLSALMDDVSISALDGSAKESPSKKTKKSVSPSKQNQNLKTTNLVGIDKLERNPEQPRRYFDNKKLEELSSSIKNKGVLQPILVRPLPKSYAQAGQKIAGRYQIVAGERRWQAALMAGLLSMPVLVRDLNDQEVLEIGVVENVQRSDLNPIEEALAYSALKDQFNRTQEDIAKAIGKSRSHVANSLRLLSLPEVAREYLVAGKITAGHARAILAAPDPQLLAEMVVANAMSVREAEKWVRKLRKPAVQKNTQAQDANTAFIETQLSDHIGLKVSLGHKNPHGQMVIKYKTLEQLEDLIKRLRSS